MALTRPTIYNLNTNIEVFNDSITVLNAAASLPTTDVGFVFNRAHGLVANAAVYWSESAQSFVYALTNSNGAPNSNIAVQSYGNVTVGNIVANTATYSPTYYYANGTNILSSVNSAISTLQANIGGYYIWANANVAGLYSSILGVQANDAAFSSNITSITANLSGYYVYANANVGALQNQITSITTNANANTAAYLSSGTVSSNIITSGVISTTNSTNAIRLNSGALNVSQGGASIFQDLWVGGNIYANALNTVTTSILSIQDPLLYLASQPTYPYNYELGFYGHFVGGPANIYAHTGFVRNHADNTWYLFSNIPEPSGNTLNLASANIVYDTLKLGNINAISTVTVNGTELFSNVSGLQNQILGANVSISSLQSNIGGYYVYANANVGALQTQINSITTNANANTVSYLATSTGNLYIGANIVSGNVFAPAYFYSNGTPFVSSNYGNTQVLANLAAAGNPVTIGGNLYVGGNVQVTGAFVGNITLGTVPGSPNNLYTVAPLNLINNQSATLKTQLNLINTGGSGGAGSAIDFYTYTNAGNGLPGARFGAIDDNNYGATFQWFIKADGNTGNNSLQSVLSINQLGNVVIPGTTTSTSTTTGALVVAGGAGIAGNLNVGNNLTVTGNLNASSNLVVGGNLTITGANGFYARPVRQDAGNVTVSAYYNPTTSEFTYQPSYNTISSVGTAPVSLDNFGNATYRTVKYTISTWDVINNQSQSAEIILAQDGNNVSISSYGVVYTGPSQKMTFQANITSSTVQLWGTGTSANNTVKISRIVIPF
jgi:hypothetical protein